MTLLDLLTDKEGNPLRHEPRAVCARVRRKERPGTPGASAYVLDRTTNEPAIAQLHEPFSVFHKLVDGKPGTYYLPFLDANGNLIDKELVGVVTINEQPRNAAADLAGGDPVLLRMLTLVERAMERAMDLAACTVEHHAGTVTANADVIRANAEATRTTHGLVARNAAPVAPQAEEEDDEEEREPTAVESLAYQCLTAVDVWWETRNARKKAEAEEVMKKAEPVAKKPEPVKPEPAKRAPSPPAADAPPSTETAPTNAQATTPTPDAKSATEGAPTATPSKAAPAPVVLTPEQAAQMHLVMSKLTAREQLAARGMVMRMSDAERARWLEEFSALTVDQAVERVREFLPEKAKGGAK